MAFLLGDFPMLRKPINSASLLKKKVKFLIAIPFKKMTGNGLRSLSCCISVFDTDVFFDVLPMDVGE